MFRLKRWHRQKTFTLLRFLGLSILWAQAACLQQDFGQRTVEKASQSSVTAASTPTPTPTPTETTDSLTEAVESFQKAYPDYEERRFEAFKRTVHPLLLRSCGECHHLPRLGESTGGANARPHADAEPRVAYDSAKALDLFSLKSAQDSRVFHMTHVIPFSDSKGESHRSIPNSPTAKAHRKSWEREIEVYGRLVGTQPKEQVSKKEVITYQLYDVLNTATEEVDRSRELPSADGWTSIAGLVESSESGEFSLGFKFKVSVEKDGYYSISELKLKSDVVSKGLQIGGIDVFLNGRLVSEASAFRPVSGFLVNFSSSTEPVMFSSNLVALLLPGVDKSSCLEQGDKTRCQDEFSFRFRGMKWVEKSVTPPSVNDPRNTRRLAAMDVLRRRCVSCHGIGSSNGAFPGATNLDATTDAMWTAKFVVAGSPTTSLLMQRLTRTPNGGPAIAPRGNLAQNMPQGGNALSLTDVYRLNDWILLMNDARTTRFELREGLGTADWNTSSTPIRMKVGDTFFVRNLDSRIHEIHTDGRPFAHQGASNTPAGATTACGTNPCGATRFQVASPVNSLPDPARTPDRLYEHGGGNAAGPGRIFMVVTP